MSAAADIRTVLCFGDSLIWTVQKGMMALFFGGAEEASRELRRHYAVVAQTCGATCVEASAAH
jgi:lysophospholipase L1-like esterase